MNNLFILHTQYNLILGSSIAKQHESDYNVLILYPEFRVTDRILENLKTSFSKIIVLRENFDSEKYGIAEIIEIIKFLKKILLKFHQTEWFL